MTQPREIETDTLAASSPEAALEALADGLERTAPAGEILLSVEGLRKTYRGNRDNNQEGVLAVDDVSFEIETGKLFTLLGPSGCGKTTTLRSIAGLETPDAGEIRVGDRIHYSSSKRIMLNANRRGLGMVFQSYAIWPHMNVARNVGYPLEVAPRGQRPSRKEIAERVERVLTIVQLDHLASRRATALSGGQQQRLALARALVMEPPLLLLDEPLSNLDAKLREGMRLELKRLQRDLGVTCLYVTHDQVEALAMSNFIAVMDGGVVQQIGRPRHIYERPTNRFVAGFIGTSNFVDGTVRARTEAGTYEVETALGVLVAASRSAFTAGDRVAVSIRPEHADLSEGQPEPVGANRWHGTVRTRAFLGEAVDHVVDVTGEEIRVRSHARLSLAEGTPVTLTFHAADLSVVADS
jgi:iron(III) transport system ATP-binding protein